jgi:plasmid stabilization system protein ParE
MAGIYQMATGESVARLLSGLYNPQIVDEVAAVADHYREMSLSLDGRKPIPIPSSLHGVTEAHYMPDPDVQGPEEKPTAGILELIGVYNGETLHGPMSHILARLFTTPRMLRGYIDNYPTAAELSIYTDPPFLQLPPEELELKFRKYFETAAEALADPVELGRRLAMLGDVCEDFARLDGVYPARNSTEAYELFGIFHLFPSNRVVDITATSPGVILPTEADPLRFKDSVEGLKKNLLRPTYFEMLRLSIESDFRRERRYSASRSGTAKSLKEYPHLADAARSILARYLELGKRFEIRLGEQLDSMKLATLVGDIGVVYSVRDPEQKDKIAHNLTVINPKEAKHHRETFEMQWANGEPITSTDVVDELIKK